MAIARPREMRVRQGSEGYEVRPVGSWNIVDEPPPQSQLPRPVVDRPWEEEGRYNVYHPDGEWEVESDDDDDEDSDKGADPPGEAR